MDFFQTLFTFLADMPGNLVYILALAFTVVGALQGAIVQWRATGYPQARRMVIGLLLLLGAQILLFAASGLIWQGMIGSKILLPPMDRAILLFSVIWVVWIWAFPEPSQPGDIASLLFSLLTIAGLALNITINMSTSPAEGTFNSSSQALVWSLASLSILATGAVVLFNRRPRNWGTGLAMALLMALGFIIDMLMPDKKGDYSGVIRFMTLAAYPLVLTLPQRFPTPTEGIKTRTVEVFQRKVADAAQESAATNRPSQPVRERRRYSTDPKTLQTLLNLAAEVESSKINEHLVRAVAQALLSDLCFLIYPSEDKNTLIMASGYDLIREEHLEGGVINKDNVPMLSNAVLRGRALRLPASTTSSDLKGLSDMLGLSSPGNLLVVPIMSDKGSLGSVMLLSPYSNRLWNADDQAFIANIASSFVPILERGKRMAAIEQDRDRTRHSAEDALAQAIRLQASNADLNNQIDALKSQLEHLAADNAAKKEALQQLDKLKGDNEQLRVRLESVQATPVIPGGEQLEVELRKSLSEMAHLQNQLAEANIRIMEMEKRPSGGRLTGDQAEVITSISQELRQPMSSIIGYADLLLGESVGILGALQRKFIERIRASTERIGSLIDDLIQITTLETGLMALKAEPVDLNLIVDNAMAYTSSQLREKNITLRIDMPENIQPIQADREALQQILIHLLQNAGAASPVEGSVSLRVRTQKEGDVDHVMISITDTGGGIPKEDLARVFTRLYRADNVLIQGVGDTGVGLSIAKSLTEAQGGRIWVETEMNNGSTFSVVLPIRRPSASTPHQAQ
jgi:signal transduction histidine kinase